MTTLALTVNSVHGRRDLRSQILWSRKSCASTLWPTLTMFPTVPLPLQHTPELVRSDNTARLFSCCGQFTLPLSPTYACTPTPTRYPCTQTPARNPCTTTFARYPCTSTPARYPCTPTPTTHARSGLGRPQWSDNVRCLTKPEIAW